MALKIGSITTRNPDTIADALAEHFAELSSLQGYSKTFLKRHPSPENAIQKFPIPPDRGQDFNQPFTLKELDFALKKCKGKSAGSDDVGYPMLKNLPACGKRTLLHLINKEWNADTLPESWKHSLVIPIPKPGGNSSDPTNFRPIALTSCVSKVMEKMANRRLIQYLEENSKLDQRQHAFRPGQGTGTYFATLGHALDEALNCEEHIEIAALDLAKAYNRTWTPRVLQQLADWGVTGHMLSFIKNYLSNRSFQVLIGNQRSKIVREETGVPQGSVIAVTLFLIAINGVFECLPKGVFIFLYADDIVIVVAGKKPKLIHRKLQAAVNAVTKWLVSVGFDISAEKSYRMHMCRHKHRPLTKPISINKVNIPTKKTLRILGVTLDRTLSFKEHFNNVYTSCKTRVNLLRTISRNRTRSDRSSRFRVANAILNSRIFFGLELTCIASEELLKRMGPIYHGAIRIISGLLPSTPATSACVEAGMLPLEYCMAVEIGCKAVSFAEKTKDDGSEAFTIREANRILQSVAGVELPPVSGVHWCGSRSWQSPLPKIDNFFKRRFNAGCNQARIKSAFAERVTTKYENFKIIYTDGSKGGTRVGIGIYNDAFTECYRLKSNCSVFSAEAAAIFQAAKCSSPTPLLIVSDSASVLEALTSQSPKHPWIQAIHTATEYRNSETVFTWVPGHCGIQGNIEADRLANLGQTAAFFTNKTPGQDIKAWIKKRAHLAWAEKWNQERLPFTRKIKGETTEWIDRLCRKEQVTLSRLRTGHTRLSHNMGSGPIFKILCDTCNIPNSVEHYVTECPKFEPLRQAHHISSIRSALRNEAAAETELISFLKEADLYKSI